MYSNPRESRGYLLAHPLVPAIHFGAEARRFQRIGARCVCWSETVMPSRREGYGLWT